MNTDCKRNRKIAISDNSIWISRTKYTISTDSKVTDKRLTLTSMHSSRMRTTRLLTVSGRGVCPTLGVGSASREGVYPTPGGLHPEGFVQPRGVLHPGGEVGQTPSPLWTEWHTSVKTLPCPKLRLWAVKTGFRSVWLDLYKIGENGMEGKDRAEGDVVLLFLNCDI